MEVGECSEISQSFRAGGMRDRRQKSPDSTEFFPDMTRICSICIRDIDTLPCETLCFPVAQIGHFAYLHFGKVMSSKVKLVSLEFSYN